MSSFLLVNRGLRALGLEMLKAATASHRKTNAGVLCTELYLCTERPIWTKWAIKKKLTIAVALDKWNQVLKRQRTGQRETEIVLHHVHCGQILLLTTLSPFSIVNIFF